MTKGQVLEKLYKIELSMRATLVMNYLINRANKEMTCFPAIKTIASDCNMSTRTVQRALKDLEVAGIIKKESRWRDNGGQSSNLYQIDFDGMEMEKGLNDSQVELSEIGFEEIAYETERIEKKKVEDDEEVINCESGKVMTIPNAQVVFFDISADYSNNDCHWGDDILMPP